MSRVTVYDGLMTRALSIRSVALLAFVATLSLFLMAPPSAEANPFKGLGRAIKTGAKTTGRAVKGAFKGGGSGTRSGAKAGGRHHGGGKSHGSRHHHHRR